MRMRSLRCRSARFGDAPATPAGHRGKGRSLAAGTPTDILRVNGGGRKTPSNRRGSAVISQAEMFHHQMQQQAAVEAEMDAQRRSAFLLLLASDGTTATVADVPGRNQPDDLPEGRE